jgi:hypothetical protein
MESRTGDGLGLSVAVSVPLPDCPPWRCGNCGSRYRALRLQEPSVVLYCLEGLVVGLDIGSGASPSPAACTCADCGAAQTP